jgi:hypothetical protein
VKNTVQFTVRDIFKSAFTAQLSATNLQTVSPGPYLQGSFARDAVVTPGEVVKIVIHASPSFEVLAAAKQAIGGLLDSRDFLGIQLSHAGGCVTDDAFELLADKYLHVEQRSEEELATLTLALAQLIGSRIDSDIVSVAFKCDLDTAERALSTAAKRLSAGLLSLTDGEHA